MYDHYMHKLTNIQWQKSATEEGERGWNGQISPRPPAGRHPPVPRPAFPQTFHPFPNLEEILFLFFWFFFFSFPPQSKSLIFKSCWQICQKVKGALINLDSLLFFFPFFFWVPNSRGLKWNYFRLLWSSVNEENENEHQEKQCFFWAINICHYWF